jgi:hypothetical protein
MSSVEINVSGAEGGGSCIKIYETPNATWRQGASVMHGSFTAGPSSPDNQRIEVVKLYIPGAAICVRASDVAAELRALLIANKAWGVAESPDTQSARDSTFNSLCGAVFGIAGRHLTVKHFDAIARDFFVSGMEQGKTLLQDQIRDLLGL